MAEVEVDTETGEVTVLSIKSAYEIGRQVNPALVEGQIRGGSLMASLVSSIPAWASFDPLPILASFEESQKDREEETESLHALVVHLVGKTGVRLQLDRAPNDQWDQCNDKHDRHVRTATLPRCEVKNGLTDPDQRPNRYGQKYDRKQKEKNFGALTKNQYRQKNAEHHRKRGCDYSKQGFSVLHQADWLAHDVPVCLPARKVVHGLTIETGALLQLDLHQLAVPFGHWRFDVALNRVARIRV